MSRLYIRILLLFALVLIGVRCAWLQAHLGFGGQPAVAEQPQETPPISLEGPALRALTVAAADLLALRHAEVSPPVDARHIPLADAGLFRTPATPDAGDLLALAADAGSLPPSDPDAGFLPLPEVNVEQDPYAITHCLLSLENYDVEVRAALDRYLIHFQPNIDRCTGSHGARVFGGDADYEISRTDFTILKRDFGE